MGGKTERHVPEFLEPQRPTKQEHRRIMMAAYRRHMSFDTFVIKLLRRGFSPSEQRQIVAELGEELFDRIFLFSDKLRGKHT